jgi:DsbC/DsbD-like thiol-disulfide interchange protein
VPVLAEFARKHAIAFPLLSDEGSIQIKALGVLDLHLDEHHANFGGTTRDDQRGVAYPIAFVLDTNGRVESKFAETNYRTRNGAQWLLRLLTGETVASAGVAASARSDVVAAVVRLDAAGYFAYQRLGLHVRLEIEPGWHVYGPTAPDGFAPVSIQLANAPAGLSLGEIRWPPTKPFRIEGLAERFEVYGGALALDIPMHFVLNRGSGNARFDVRIEFQACSATECRPPSALVTSFDVPEEAVPA